jgi:hypothetical protein
MTPRVVVRWLVLAAMCLVMFLLGQISVAGQLRRQPAPPGVTVLEFTVNGHAWTVPCVLPNWPRGAISCDWDGASESKYSEMGTV